MWFLVMWFLHIRRAARKLVTPSGRSLPRRQPLFQQLLQASQQLSEPLCLSTCQPLPPVRDLGIPRHREASGRPSGAPSPGDADRRCDAPWPFAHICWWPGCWVPRGGLRVSLLGPSSPQAARSPGRRPSKGPGDSEKGREDKQIPSVQASGHSHGAWRDKVSFPGLNGPGRGQQEQGRRFGELRVV